MALAIAGGPLGGHPAAATETSWVTGPALEQRLAAPVDVVWSGNPLRQALRGLARAQRVAVLLDRRVDPEQRIEVKLASVPLGDAIRQIAESRQLGVSFLGPVAYFGPPERAAVVRTLAAIRVEDARRLPAAAARRLLVPKSWAWEDFATPRDLLGHLAEEAGIEMAGRSQVPHDLWASADLPPLAWVDRITLVAIQFDLTFEIAAEGQQVRLIPLPEHVAMVRSYPAGPDPAAAAKRYEALAPEAEIKIVGEKIYVRGLLEEHERIAGRPGPAVRAPASPKAASGGEVVIRRFVVHEQPVGKVLGQLAARLQFELRPDSEALRAAGISLDQRVSVELDSPTLDEVLRELLRSTPLAYRRKGKVVEIYPK